MSGKSITLRPPFEILESMQPDPAGLGKILDRLAARTDVDAAEAGSGLLDSGPAAWSEAFHLLDRSALFQSLNEESKNRVLRRCARGILEEALLIEIAGMSFAAKMSLLAETLAQRELYSRFAAEEASHFRMIQCLTGPPRKDLLQSHSFAGFLARQIETETRAPLILLIQVVLEGWGIPYYSRLAEQARVPEIRRVLKSIVEDEAAHHGSGLLLSKSAPFSSEELERLESSLAELLSMLRAGPANVVFALASETGGLSRDELSLLLEECSFHEKISADLTLIRHLLEKGGAHVLCERLRERGLFKVPSLEECVGMLAEGLATVA